MIIKQTTELLLGEEVWFQKAVNNTALFYLRGGQPGALQLVSQAPPTLQSWG